MCHVAQGLHFCTQFWVKTKQQLYYRNLNKCFQQILYEKSTSALCISWERFYDSVEDLTYVWRTRAWKNYLGMKIVQNDTQSDVFLGNFGHTVWFWHLKASVMCIFKDFCNFMDKFGQKSLFWSTWHIFWQCNLEYEKTAVMLLIIDIFWH